MLKRLLMFAPLPLLTACGEIEIPFLAPVNVQIPEVGEPDADGLIHHIQASEMKSLDDLRAELPEGMEGLEDFLVTGLTISEPEPLDLGDDLGFEQVFLSDYLLQVRVFISSDQERSDDDILLAVVERFDPDTYEHEALILEAAQLSRYSEGGFALITEADFIAVPPPNLDIPMTLRGVATMQTLPSLRE